MSTLLREKAEAERFRNIIKDTSNEIKLILINKLSESIIEKSEVIKPKMKADKKTQ